MRGAVNAAELVMQVHRCVVSVLNSGNAGVIENYAMYGQYSVGTWL